MGLAPTRGLEFTRYLFLIMAISLTQQEFFEQYQEADKEKLNFDPLDKLDITLKHNGRIGQGCKRYIQLREGIKLQIDREQFHDRLLWGSNDYEAPLNWHFLLSGKQQMTYDSSHKETSFSYDAGQYICTSTGWVDRIINDHSDTESFLDVTIFVQPEVLRSFVSDSSGELPKVFEHLVKSRECSKRVGETPPMVNTILQQIIQCPYQGLTKRIYLESKATEIMALMLEEEAAVQQQEFKTSVLQPDQLERIYYAKEILLKTISNPPSLMELASQVGMCDYNLKRGFKEVFGTTVFGYLRDRRLEKAQQLLLDGQMKVASVAHTVGYDSPTSFNAAFKRKYGVSPKAYQMGVRNR